MKINGKAYTEPVLNYAAIRCLQHVGLDVFNADKDPLCMVDGYVFLATNAATVEEAQELIDKHIENGGDVEELANAMANAIEKSGFFRQLQAKAQKKTEKA